MADYSGVVSSCMHNMAEQIKPFEPAKSIPTPENNQDAFEKLKLENQNLKREIEELKNRRDIMGAEKKDMEMELQRERRNTSSAQQLVEELNRNRSGHPTTRSLPGNDEITRVGLEKSGLEKQLSDEISKIDDLNSELKLTKEQLSSLKQDSNKPKAEFIDLELKFGELQKNYDSLSQEREMMSQKMEDLKQSSLESKRRQSDPGRKSEKIEVQRGLSEALPPILDEDWGETDHNSGDELVAAKIQIGDQRTHILSLENQKAEETHQRERLEFELRALQGVNEELNLAKITNQELGNSNKELREEVNRLNDALMEKENRNKELQIRMELVKGETQELRREAIGYAPSPEFEQDICEVEPHRNAPPSSKHHQEQPQGYSAPPTPSRQEYPTDQLFDLSPDTTENPFTPYQDPPPTHFDHKIPQNVSVSDITSPLSSGHNAKVTIIWRKETATLDRTTTYFDNNHEELPIQLTWIAADTQFQGKGDFKMGQHHGSILVNEEMHEIQPFMVSGDVEKITIKFADAIGADAVP